MGKEMNSYIKVNPSINESNINQENIQRYS